MHLRASTASASALASTAPLTASQIRKALDEHGFCVVPGVLTPEEAGMGRTMFHSWRVVAFGTDVANVGKACTHGVIKDRQVGHQQLAWSTRCNPQVQGVFASIWGTDKLVTSFDGCGYVSEGNTKKDGIWTHTDQAATTVGTGQCYQGFVSFTDNAQRTFVVYDGSHKKHAAYFDDERIKKLTENKKDPKKNWQPLAAEYLAMPEMAATRVVVPVAAGSLVVWDSCCFHQNLYGPTDSSEGERLVQYVCFLPKDNKKNTSAMQAKRQKYFEERRTTSHFPYPIAVNPLQPRTYGKEDNMINYDALQAPDLEPWAEAMKAIM